MPECTAPCVSSLHRTPLARYPAIGQQPACPFAREFDHRRTQRSGTCPSPGPSWHLRDHRLPVRPCWSSRSSSPPPASSPSRRRPRAQRRPSGSDRRAASSTDPAPGPPERSSRPARAWRRTPSSPTTSPSSAITASPGRGASSPPRALMERCPCHFTGPASTRGSTSPLGSTRSLSVAPLLCPPRTSSTPARRAAARPPRTASTTPARRASPFRQATSTGSSSKARTATPTISFAAT